MSSILYESTYVYALVERWTHTLLGEFLSLKSRFKHILKEKWEKDELNVNSDMYNRERELHEHVKNLERSKEDYMSKTHFDRLRTFLKAIDKDTNVNELKNKIQDELNVYLKIFESLEFIEQYQENGSRTSFETTKNILHKLQTSNNKKSHTICIIGLEKSGKSTFINALLGYKLLPAKSERCTQIRTVLKPTLEDQPLLFAQVKFYNDDEFKVLFEKMIKKSDEDPQQYESRKKQVQQKWKKFKEDFPQGEELLMKPSNHRNSDNQHSKIMDKLHSYITDEFCVNIIKEISIYTEKLPGNYLKTIHTIVTSISLFFVGKNYELLDVPGSDSPIKEHRDAAIHAIKLADAFLFLTDGGRPSLTRDQIRLLNEIQDGRQHFEAMKRAFGIITKLDMCHTQDEYHEHFNKTRKELLSKIFKADHIFAVCSVTNFPNENSKELQTIANKIREFDNLQDGFQQCKQALNQFIELELPKTHLHQLIDIGSTKICHYIDESIANARKILPSNIDFDEYIKQEIDQKWDKIYNDEFFQPTFDKANVWQKAVLIQERDRFLDETKRKFRDCFNTRTEEFMKDSVDIHSQMIKHYDYTALQSTSQPFDDQSRMNLSFELEEAVIQTINTLARHLHDEYVSQLEKILNEISGEENNDLYRTQLLSYDICRHEIRAIVLRICRPIITATLRFSHSDGQSRHDAIKELILIAPTNVCRLYENNVNLASTLKEGIKYVLALYGNTDVQNNILAAVLKTIQSH